MVEESTGTKSISNFWTCGQETTTGRSTNEPSSSRFNENEGSHQRGKGHRLLQWLREHPTAPLKHILNTRTWYNSPYTFWAKSNTTLLTCFNIRQLETLNMNTQDYINYYKTVDATKLIFNAPDGEISNYYYDLNESREIMNNLLNFQFNANEDDIHEFLQSLYSVCEKELPKKNCLCVVSPSCAGKNFFFDTIIHFYLNFGQIGNFNRYCNFPLMDCVNRRIIIWNEPIAEPSAFETLKCIFGGDTTNVKVKYADDSIMQRTPVIVLTNSFIFPKDKAFKSRMIRYDWRTCDILKEYKKKPHPLVWPLLLSQYNILQ